MIFNYQEIGKDLMMGLPARAQEIIIRRFGLENEKRETLQNIGQDLGITRERVRQIEKMGFSKMKEKTGRHGPVFDFFQNQLKTTGSLRKEDILLNVLSAGPFQNQAFLLLSLNDNFQRIFETEDLYTFWTIDRNALKLVKKTTQKISEKLKKISQPLNFGEIETFSRIDSPALLAFLELSKEIYKGPQGLWGLKDWAEIMPKSTKDKAYLVFKKENKPLHFTQVAELINESGLFEPKKKAHLQTVHNELIKDPRFILIGRGLYGLKEWGYEPGVIKDVIVKILEKSKKPLKKEEIVEEALKQRFAKKNTILLNLNDKEIFKKTLDGKYTLVN